MPADSATHTFEFAAIAFAGPLPLMDPNMGPRWRKMAMWGGRTSGGQAGIIKWLHAAQEMGESVLAVHLPGPLTMTDIGLLRIFQAPESLHGFTPLRKWVSPSSLSTRPAP